MKRKKPQDGAQEEAPQVETRRALADDDHLYLQENFVVTDGIFIDENIIFDERNLSFRHNIDKSLFVFIRHAAAQGIVEVRHRENGSDLVLSE